MENLKQKLEQIILESPLIAHKEENISAIHILQIQIEKLLLEANHLGFKECAERINKIIDEVKSEK